MHNRSPLQPRRLKVFQGFSELDVEVNGVRLRGKTGPNNGKPALLLLHGHPENHMMWHRVAPKLAEDFFLVLPDLRGYGRSDRPNSGTNHAGYSNREMARDAVALMEHFGCREFGVAGHDRGARVAARLAVDSPDRVSRAMLLDIAPTLAMYEGTTRDFASGYWHWFFLTQPAPLPETLIGANPRAYVEGIMGGRHAGLTPFPAEILEHYVAGFAGPERAMGACEDYRASATIDLDHDRADIAQGVMIKPELRVLWAKHGIIEKLFDPLPLWGKIASTVSGRSIDSGHYLPEENPEEILKDMRDFFNAAS
jgi:haloacetate dehalogenase